MFKNGKLLRNITPEDESSKKNPKFYSKGSKIEITPLGYYLPIGSPLAGWIYKNLKTKSMDTLKQGIDFEFID